MKPLRLLAVLVLAFALAPAAHAEQAAYKPSCSMQTLPATINKGDSITLKWSSQGATAASITGVSTRASLSGSINLIPTQSTRYVGLFSNTAGTTTCNATVVVLVNGVPGGVVDAGTVEPPDTVEAPPQLGAPPQASPAPILPAGSSQTPQSNASGQGLVPCNGTDCQACNLAQLGQNIINWLMGLSIPLAAALFAWAGIIYFSSSVETSYNKIDKAKAIFRSTVVGFLIVICAWLGVETMLKTILAPSYYQNWHTIQCSSKRLMNKNIQDLLNTLPGLNTTPIVVSNTPSYVTPSVLTPPPGGGCDRNIGCWNSNGTVLTNEETIALAASQYQGTNTSAGPDGGNLACAWAVNNILNNVGIPPIDGNSVPSMEQQLNAGRGTLEDQSGAQPGDLVFFGGLSHVGVCMNVGCTQALSNSSSNATFTNTMPPSTGSRFYKVN